MVVYKKRGILHRKHIATLAADSIFYGLADQGKGGREGGREGWRVGVFWRIIFRSDLS